MQFELRKIATIAAAVAKVRLLVIDFSHTSDDKGRRELGAGHVKLQHTNNGNNMQLFNDSHLWLIKESILSFALVGDFFAIKTQLLLSAGNKQFVTQFVTEPFR